MTRTVRPWLFAWLGVCVMPALAHEIRPALLQIEEGTRGQVTVLLKLPVFRDMGVAAAQPVFPADCSVTDSLPARQLEETVTKVWHLHCPAGLESQTFAIDGFSRLAPDALVLVRFADGSESSHVLTQDQPSALLRKTGVHGPQDGSLFAYIPIGIEHILLGFDHLMFVLGLILVAWRAGAGPRVLLVTITAFTLAHSITLAAAVLGGVSLPGATVETLIALSILMLAVELARSLKDCRQRPAGLTFRMPWLVAFVFGLLHGFGFAGALVDTGLPPNAQGWALLLFNVGVEAGQLMFIGAVFALYQLTSVLVRLPLLRVATALTWFLGVVSAAWVLDRAAAVFIA